MLLLKKSALERKKERKKRRCKPETAFIFRSLTRLKYQVREVARTSSVSCAKLLFTVLIALIVATTYYIESVSKLL